MLYGGHPNYADTWAWDGATWTLLDPAGPPGPRHSCPMVFDTARQSIVAFGGARATTGTYLDDTWAWDGSNWTFVTQGGPTPRADAVCAFDSVRDRTVLCSGNNSNTIFTDTWELNGSTWMRRSTFGLPGRQGGNDGLAACFDRTRAVTVLFGGSNSGYGLTYEWDGQFWTQTASFGPPNREDPVVCFDSQRNQVILVGGRQPLTGSCDTWEYNGITRLWTQVDDSGPAARVSHAITYDEARKAVVLFGGYTQNGVIAGDTWVRTAAPVLTETPSDRTLCPLGIAQFDVTVIGNGPFMFRWQVLSETGGWTDLEDGDVEFDGPNRPFLSITGASTAMVTAQRRFREGNPKGGEVLLRCAITNACGLITTNPAVMRTCAADANCSGEVTVQDIFDFLAAYFANVPNADFNNSGVIGVQDIFDFLAAYFTGCD